MEREYFALECGQDFVDATTQLSFCIVEVREAESLALAEAVTDGGQLTVGGRLVPLLRGTRLFFKLAEVVKTVRLEDRAVDETLARWRTGISACTL